MAGKSILVVDDNKSISDSFREILELNGHLVDVAEDGKTALDRLKNKHYDLALLDIKLPDMEGTDLLAVVHRNRPTMIKIMVTGFATMNNAVESLNNGANAFLTKPVDPANLVQVVEEKLKEKEHENILNEEKVSQWIENRLNGLDNL